MSHIARRITTALVATALIIPLSVSTAPAQSSFGSSSDFLTSSTTDPKVTEIERSFKKYLEHNGITHDPTLERAAKTLVNQAVNGELIFDAYNFYYYKDPATGIEYEVVRLTETEADNYIAEIDAIISSTPPVVPPTGTGGISVKKQGEYYYVAAVADRT